MKKVRIQKIGGIWVINKEYISLLEKDIEDDILE